MCATGLKPIVEIQFGDAARVADIGLEDRCGPLFENLPEAPLGENPFAGRQRDVRLLREFRHNVDIQRLHHLFVEPGMIGL